MNAPWPVHCHDTVVPAEIRTATGAKAYAAPFPSAPTSTTTSSSPVASANVPSNVSSATLASRYSATRASASV
ncbi:hypothetical protein [Halosegnis marinus]|uniref:hypothetical protein n=1 Tax=Halosegnis marinus TaxID=3034023 RepID=UPI00360CB840